MKDCTVVVCSCDDYEDVWELFFCALRDNWDGCKYDVVLNTESKQTDIHGVRVHNSKYLKESDKWGERLINTLNAISSKYVIVVLDDYVLEGKVNIDEIFNCINHMELNRDIAAFYLTTCSPDIVKDSQFNMFDKIAKRGNYKLNLAPAVWNKEKMLSYLRNDDTPWAWEFFGSYRAYKTKDLFYQVKNDVENIYPYFTSGSAIFRGKWQRERVMPLVEKYNLNLDLTKRGCVPLNPENSKRSWSWKIAFFRKGFEAIGFAVIIFIFRVLKSKILKKTIS